MVSNEYTQPLAALVRLYRWARNRCLVCGRGVGDESWLRFFFEDEEPSHYRYCSITCACYDATMAVRTDVKTKPSRVLTGSATWKWRPKEEKYL